MTIERKPLPDHDLLTTREVAAAFGMSIRSIDYQLRHGRFPNAFRMPGMTVAPGRWRIPRADVLAVVRELETLP